MRVNSRREAGAHPAAAAAVSAAPELHAQHSPAPCVPAIPPAQTVDQANTPPHAATYLSPDFSLSPFKHFLPRAREQQHGSSRSSDITVQAAVAAHLLPNFDEQLAVFVV
jgi:hypothetical protein